MKNIKLKRLFLLFLAGCLLVMVLISQRPPEDGWSTMDGQTIYYLDGQPVTGWQDFDGNRYYYGADGFLRTGW